MTPCEKLADVEREIRGLERALNVTFSRSYRQFLLEREEIEGEAGFRLPVLGLPISEELNSAYGATLWLKEMRPDLKDKPLVCARLVGDWAVCLDLREKPEEDCPLVQVSWKNKEIPIVQTNPSFKGAIQGSIRDYQRAQAAKQRVANRREEVEREKGGEFSHQQPIKRLFFLFLLTEMPKWIKLKLAV